MTHTTDREWSEMLRDEMRHDADAPEVWCACCGKPVDARRDWLWECRHYQCEDCCGTAWPLECLTCLKEAVAEQGNVWKRAYPGMQASWHAGPCPFPTCAKQGPHEHLVGPNTYVTERIA